MLTVDVLRDNPSLGPRYGYHSGCGVLDAKGEVYLAAWIWMSLQRPEWFEARTTG